MIREVLAIAALAWALGTFAAGAACRAYAPVDGAGGRYAGSP